MPESRRYRFKACLAYQPDHEYNIFTGPGAGNSQLRLGL